MYATINFFYTSHFHIFLKSFIVQLFFDLLTSEQLATTMNDGSS